MSTAALDTDSKRISYRKTAIVGFGFLVIIVVWSILNQFIPIFLQAGSPVFEQQLIEVGGEGPQDIGLSLTPAVALFVMTWGPGFCFYIPRPIMICSHQLAADCR